jgi:hypothetical protein
MKFKSVNSYREFAQSVAKVWRYSRHEQADFLAALTATCGSRLETLTKGTTLYRAQEGHDWREVETGGEAFEIPAGYGSSRMKPFPDRAREGRANARGIPCFYSATHLETAIAEVRPWIGSYVTVAWFKAVRDLRLVNLTNDGKPGFRLVDSESDRERVNWAHIGAAFSRPVSANDHFADYAPTQVIAEHFRGLGYDGVGYGSALGPGHNLALFDIDSAEIQGGLLRRITAIRFESSHEDGPYTFGRPDE